MRSSSTPFLSLAAALCGLSVLTGCSSGTLSTVTTGEQALTLKGVIHGGQNPVSGATIGLYRAGASGLGSAATQILSHTVTSDANGQFSISGLYTCASASDQMYLLATGGNPGLSGSVNNAALAMVAPLGSCGSLSSLPFIQINEVSTAAAAWALAQFSTDATHLGATSTNALGLTNAFADAALLVNVQTGYAATLASTQVVETGKLYALADILATCVNSDGTTPCSSLFSTVSPTGGTPTDTWQAVLRIVKNPGYNVSNLYALIGAQPPFPTGLSTAPHDWTMSMTVTGAGIASPTTLGIDQQGNVWVADYAAGVSAYTPQGVPMSPTAYATPYTAEVYSLAIDPSGNLWVTNEESPTHGATKGSLTKIAGAQAATPGQALGGFYDTSIDYPEAIAADSNGNLQVANFASGTVTVFNNAGTIIASGLGAGSISTPVSIYPDSTHGMWVASQQSGNVVHLSSSGSVLSSTSCCASVNAVAPDASGNVWASDYGTSSTTELSPSGSVLVTTATGAGGLNAPSSVAIDGAQNVWLASYRGATISEFAGTAGGTAAGTALSPSTGYGQDAGTLGEPFSLEPDASGNLWVSNYSKNNLVMFFGLASPTKTPLQPVPAAP